MQLQQQKTEYFYVRLSKGRENKQDYLISIKMMFLK